MEKTEKTKKAAIFLKKPYTVIKANSKREIFVKQALKSVCKKRKKIKKI